MSADISFRPAGDYVIVTEKWRLDDPDLPWFVIAPEGAATVAKEFYMRQLEVKARFGEHMS